MKLVDKIAKGENVDKEIRKWRKSRGGRMLKPNKKEMAEMKAFATA